MNTKERYIPKKTRLAVLERDHYACRKCNETKRNQLEIHHIEPPRNDINLLITLCYRCHKEAPNTMIKMNEYLEVKLPPDLEKSCILTKLITKLYLVNKGVPYLSVEIDEEKIQKLKAKL